MMFADLLDALSREGLEELESTLRYAYHRQWRGLELNCYGSAEGALKPTVDFDHLRTIRNAISRTRDAIVCLPTDETK